MVKQKIEFGNNNIQISGVQGSVIIDKRRPHFLPNDPNVVDCPFHCGQQTWFNSDKCWNCDRPVAQYFEYKEQLERQRQSRRFGMIVSLVMNIIAMVVGLYFINLSEYVLANAFGSLLSMLGYPILALGTALNLGLGIKFWLTKDD
ncbi:hypothetical protein [Shewanella sp. KJ2020]|uniref:hypothetical protein n=1 Tax=Shewanella sp. KJ2020 TaxID=2919172 RepID=UPI0020A6F86B|nr:hypothetical protein [Shewanella sp. KJ2020]MCP3130045.1 hypothetical protein [Shewanella sp. KJ2020]